MYRIDTAEFILEFEPQVFLEDLEQPVNTALTVYVYSYGFSARAVLDIGVRQFSLFAERLLGLYQTLSGKARLEEPYGMHNFIEFEAAAGGHIKVTGCIHNGRQYGYSQELSFENEFDQTFLQAFAERLSGNYRRYAV